MIKRGGLIPPLFNMPRNQKVVEKNTKYAILIVENHKETEA